jgi:hypothetical protein
MILSEIFANYAIVFRVQLEQKLKFTHFNPPHFRDPGKMTVLDIREEGEGGGGGWRFSWTNETLPLQYCPREEVNYLLTCS